MEIHCPACENWFLGDVDVAPRMIRWTCPECQAEFDITIGYMRLFKHDFKEKEKQE